MFIFGYPSPKAYFWSFYFQQYLLIWDLCLWIASLISLVMFLLQCFLINFSRFQSLSSHDSNPKNDSQWRWIGIQITSCLKAIHFKQRNNFLLLFQSQCSFLLKTYLSISGVNSTLNEFETICCFIFPKECLRYLTKMFWDGNIWSKKILISQISSNCFKH